MTKPLQKLQDFRMNRVGLAIYILIFIALMVDLYFLVFEGVRGTISTWMTNLGLVAPFPQVVLGMLLNHFFFAGTMYSSEISDRRVWSVVLWRLLAFVAGAFTYGLVRWQIAGSL